jgi:hypothetical protein
MQQKSGRTIRKDEPSNEVKRGVEASLMTSMGRLDRLTKDSQSPLQADAGGRYPVPQPGTTTKREY